MLDKKIFEGFCSSFRFIIAKIMDAFNRIVAGEAIIVMRPIIKGEAEPLTSDDKLGEKMQ